MGPAVHRAEAMNPPISDPERLLPSLHCITSLNTSDGCPVRRRILMPVLTGRPKGTAFPSIAQQVDQVAEQTHLCLILTALVGVELSTSTKQCLPTRKVRANSWFSQAAPLFCLQPHAVM